MVPPQVLTKSSPILKFLFLALQPPYTKVSQNPDLVSWKYLMILALQGPVYGGSRQKTAAGLQGWEGLWVR